MRRKILPNLKTTNHNPTKATKTLSQAIHASSSKRNAMMLAPATR